MVFLMKITDALRDFNVIRAEEDVLGLGPPYVDQQPFGCCLATCAFGLDQRPFPNPAQTWFCLQH